MDVVTLIELHTTYAPPAAPHLEPDMHPEWARQRQGRFDAAGLPRGLMVVA